MKMHGIKLIKWHLNSTICIRHYTNKDVLWTHITYIARFFFSKLFDFLVFRFVSVLRMMNCFSEFFLRREIFLINIPMKELEFS